MSIRVSRRRCEPARPPQFEFESSRSRRLELSRASVRAQASTACRRLARGAGRPPSVEGGGDGGGDTGSPRAAKVIEQSAGSPPDIPGHGDDGGSARRASGQHPSSCHQFRAPSVHHFSDVCLSN